MRDSLVEVEYKPYEKIIVHELRKLEVQDFFLWVASQVEAQKQGATPTVQWVDGIAFVTGEFMVTPEMVSENLKGRIHYAVVFFTEAPYQPEKRVTVNGRDSVVRFAKGETNPNFVALVRFLKANVASQRTPANP